MRLCNSMYSIAVHKSLLHCKERGVQLMHYSPQRQHMLHPSLQNRLMILAHLYINIYE